MEKDFKKIELTLGLDIGSNSIGWALLEATGGKVNKIVAAGAHVFDPGLDNPDDFGLGESKNKARRDARLMRRQTERRARRIRNMALALQSSCLLPPGELFDSKKRNEFFNEHDKNWGSPYLIRTKALDEKLSLHEIGRALYHLAQRRGFLSNRKTPQRASDDLGSVRKQIGELGQKIADERARSLGEYQASLQKDRKEVRRWYTARQMRLDEFNAIWRNQQVFYSDILNESLKRTIHRIIFHQRPLKSQRHLIGECSLERGRKRAPMSLLVAQRVRYLQKLNDLRIIDTESGEAEIRLTPEQRNALMEELDITDKLSFGAMRRLLKKKKIKFNFEFFEEDSIPGNKTAAKIIKVIGKERWNAFSNQDHEALVEDLRSINSDTALARRARKRWGFNENTSKEFSEINLEAGYFNYSRQALEKLLPYLQEGKSLYDTKKEGGYLVKESGKSEPKESLPPVLDCGLGDLRNPAIIRALTELRKLVSAVVGKYKLPDLIKVELARDIRQTAKKREQLQKNMRANEKERENAKRKIQEWGISEPGRDDIIKYILAEECNWDCPYTGKHISMDSLFASAPQFDIEHIIPYDRSLDNSFTNKTLCDVRENREVKRNRTPYETYHGAP